MRAHAKSPAPAGATPSFIAVPVYCECDRFGGRQHGIAPGCPGMDGPLQFIPGAQPGTVVAATDPRPGRGKRSRDGAVTLVPHTLEEQAAIARLQGVAPALGAAAWPEVPAAYLFEEYEKEIADRPEKLKDLRRLKGRFMGRFATMPSAWPPLRDFLNESYPGPTRRTKRNRFDSLRGLYAYAVSPLHALPWNPMEGARRPDAQSRGASPLSLDVLRRLHERAMQAPVRDKAIWLLHFALGWRPIECPRLLIGDVRQAVAKADGFIPREQKHRAGRADKSPSPIVPEVLDVLRQLVETLGALPDAEPIFRSTSGSGRHQSRSLGVQGIGGVIRRLFAAAGVRDEVPDAVPYDLRDSFATIIGRRVRASGGRTSEAQDVARRLLGHGDGGDVLARYWDDDERDEELARFGPLAWIAVEKEGSPPPRQGVVVAEIEGAFSRAGDGVVEIGGLEPPTSAMRTRRSPS